MLRNDKIFIKLGDGLLSKVKYDFNFTYDRYNFLKSFFQDKLTLKSFISKQLYKKLK